MLMDKAQQVVEAYMERFPNCGEYSDKPSPEDVEALMRPFYPITYETQRQINVLFRERGLDSTLVGERCWWEANFAVSGDGPRHAYAVKFLCMDPCTCTTVHLPDAVAHAQGEVDARILALLDREQSN